MKWYHQKQHILYKSESLIYWKRENELKKKKCFSKLDKETTNMQESQNKYCVTWKRTHLLYRPQKYFYLNVKNYLQHIFNLSIHEIW